MELENSLSQTTQLESEIQYVKTENANWKKKFIELNGYYHDC
jgi:hypothetical protein